MRMGIGLVAALSLCLLVGTGVSSAQTTDNAAATSSEDRFQQLERRLNEMDERYQAELQTRDQEIARLKAQLDGQAATTRMDEVEKTKQEIFRDIEKRERSPLTHRPAADMNPNLGVITDFRGNVSTDDDNPARNRWDVGSVELDLRAAVDPRADGVVILHFAREVEDPLFLGHHDEGEDEEGEEEGEHEDHEHAAGEIEHHIAVEEAYLFLHDFGVPNLTATLGRFKVPFGRWNLLHMHNWATTDNAFVMQSFFGPEGLSDAGLTLSYVIPPRAVAGQYIEISGSILSGEGDEHNPVFNNDAFGDVPAFNTHIKWNRDVARNWNVELGASWLTGTRDGESSRHADVVGADITLVRTDPSGGFNNQLFQAEVLYGDIDTEDGVQHPLGAYLLAQQQLNRDWYAGVRLDWTENAVNDSEEAWGVSPYVTWYWSEFLRFRAEYQHKQGDVPSEDTLWFQATWTFGAHPPHPYYAMR